MQFKLFNEESCPPFTSGNQRGRAKHEERHGSLGPALKGADVPFSKDLAQLSGRNPSTNWMSLSFLDVQRDLGERVDRLVLFNCHRRTRSKLLIIEPRSGLPSVPSNRLFRTPQGSSGESKSSHSYRSGLCRNVEMLLCPLYLAEKRPQRREIDRSLRPTPCDPTYQHSRRSLKRIIRDNFCPENSLALKIASEPFREQT